MTAPAELRAPVVHPTPRRNLTLSEVDHGPRDGRPQLIHRPASTGTADITLDTGTLEAIALAVGAHLSPRAGTALAQWDRPGSLEARAAFVLQAIGHAARCPVCAPTLPELRP